MMRLSLKNFVAGKYPFPAGFNLYPIIVLYFFVVLLSACSRGADAPPSAAASRLDFSFSKVLPEALIAHEIGLTADIEVLSAQNGSRQVFPLLMNKESQLVSALFSGLELGFNTFRIRYWKDGVVIATEIAEGEVLRDEMTLRTFESLIFSDDDHDGINNLDELFFGTRVNMPLAKLASFSAGSSHGCAIKMDGTLWCWGSNRFSQLGNNARRDELLPKQEASQSSDWESVSAGGIHSCGIKTNRSLWCWGSNVWKQLGTGDDILYGEPTEIGDGTRNWVMVSAGLSHSCGIRSDQGLWCWGSNFEGELGIGRPGPGVEVSVPTKLEGEEKPLSWLTVSVGWRHSCGIKTDGTLWCWGENGQGQLGANSLEDSFRPIQETSESTDWQSLSTAKAHSCGIKTDGTLWCWGSNARGQLGDNSNVNRLVPTQEFGRGNEWQSISASWEHSCGLKTDDTLWCWGGSDRGQLGEESRIDQLLPILQKLPLNTRWLAIDGGAAYSCALSQNSILWCWGSKAVAQLGDGLLGRTGVAIQENSLARDWTLVASGKSHTCGLDRAGSLSCWGSNEVGQLGEGTTLRKQVPLPKSDRMKDWVTLSVGANHSCGIKSDRTMWCWGKNTDGLLGTGDVRDRLIPSQEQTKADTWRFVSAGTEHSCAIKTDNTLWCWGLNGFGQLGGSRREDKSIPTQENTAETDWMSVSAGGRHSCATKFDGTLWCWGDNSAGEIGDGSGELRQFPAPVDNLKDSWRTISTGGDISCGIKTDNSLWCWGSNTWGSLGIGRSVPTFSSPNQEASSGFDWLSLSAGFQHVCAIKINGSLWCWGNNLGGQLGNASVLAEFSPAPEASGGTNWSGVSAGRYHTCATKTDGTLWCWGDNFSGELGNGEAWRASPQPVHLEG